MARVFKRKDRLTAMSEINLTSLMDLVFCLLIIFMIATPLLEQSVPVNLPKQTRDASSQRDPKLQYQAITIDGQGRYFFGRNPVSAEELRVQLKGLAAQPEPPVVDIRADPALPFQKVMDVVDLVRQAGLTKLSFPTQVK